MVGRLRLDNVHECVERVVVDGVPGDLMETGVWRGGDYGHIETCRRAVTDYRAAHGIDDPIVAIDYSGAYWQRRK